MSLAVTTQSQLTAFLPTAPAPSSVQGSYKCVANNAWPGPASGGVTPSPMFPETTIPQYPTNPTYTAIVFTPTTGFTTQGGNLTYMSNGSGTTSQLGGNNASNDYWYQDSAGNLVYMTTIAAVVSAYAVNSTYTLNLSPSY